MELNNKVAVITGAASGMGAACAHYLASQGVKVALLDQHLEVAEVLAKELNGVAFACDVANEKQAEQAIAGVVKKFSAIHININCAGIAPAERVVGREGPMPLEHFHRVLHVNLLGTFNILRLAAAQMLKQELLNEDNERGVIINTASIAAFDGQLGQAAYSASKGGVVSMTLPIARELGKFGVRVMTIAPGIIATPMMQQMPEKVQQSLADEVVFPKRLGAPTEYARLVRHIIENSYLNGSVIRLDGAIRMT